MVIFFASATVTMAGEASCAKSPIWMSASTAPAPCLPSARTPSGRFTVHADQAMLGMALSADQKWKRIKANMTWSMKWWKMSLSVILGSGAVFVPIMVLSTWRGRRSSRSGAAVTAGAGMGRSGVRRWCVILRLRGTAHQSPEQRNAAQNMSVRRWPCQVSRFKNLMLTTK